MGEGETGILASHPPLILLSVSGRERDNKTFVSPSLRPSALFSSFSPLESKLYQHLKEQAAVSMAMTLMGTRWM